MLRVTFVITLFLSKMAMGQPFDLVFSLCDGIPPQGYAFCECEQAYPLVYDWTCFNEENEQEELPPTSSDE